jgi:hypothetical protein
MLAELRMERESRLADIERLVAIDVEAAGAPPDTLDDGEGRRED